MGILCQKYLVPSYLNLIWIDPKITMKRIFNTKKLLKKLPLKKILKTKKFLKQLHYIVLKALKMELII